MRRNPTANTLALYVSFALSHRYGEKGGGGGGGGGGVLLQNVSWAPIQYKDIILPV